MFELIIEFNQPIAAILPKPLTQQQLLILYALLPQGSILQRQLAARWGKHMVMAPNCWADEQFRRVPMLPPHGVKLSFAQ